MPPKKRAASAGKGSPKPKGKKSKKVAKVEEHVALPPTLEELLAAITIPSPGLRTLDSRSGGNAGRSGANSKANTSGGAIFSTCSYGTTVFAGLLNGLINMTFSLGAGDQGGDIRRGGGAGDAPPTSNPNAVEYSSQRIRTVELAAHGGMVTRMAVVVDTNKPPPAPKSTAPASPYTPYGKSKEDATPKANPRDVLLSCSVDGTVKKWSLPDCSLLNTYKPPAPVETEIMDGDDDEEEHSRPHTGFGSRPGTSPAGVNRRRPVTSSGASGRAGGIDGSMVLTGGASANTNADDLLIPVNGFALATNGDTLYVGDDGGFLHSYNFHTGEHLDRIRVHHGRVTDICVPVAPPVTDSTPPAEQEPPRAGCVITASDDGFCRLVDPTAKSVHAVFVCAHSVHSLCYRHPTVLAGCGDGNIRGYNIHTAQQCIQLRHHKDSVNRLFLVPEGREGTAPGPPADIQQAADSVAAAAAAPIVDKRIVVSVSDDLNICWWDFQFPLPMYIIPAAHTHNITDATVDTDGRLHSGCFAGKLRSWDYAGVMQVIRERDRVREEAAPKPKKAPKPAPKGRGLRR